MYFADLTLYGYGHTEHVNALNIGWLERGKEFPVGDFPEKEEVIKKLRTKKKENLYRGFHSCDFCDVTTYKENDSTFIIRDRHGNGEYIFQHDGKTYAAPEMIIHYIETHNYKPPQEFIDAVVAYNEKEESL
ncbi:MAG: hypothetical protein WC333_00315 [Dehalococcoidia bacterium]|jgi:hypothetical protein